jgi:hypothetical protein
MPQTSVNLPAISKKSFLENKMAALVPSCHRVGEREVRERTK